MTFENIVYNLENKNMNLDYDVRSKKSLIKEEANEKLLSSDRNKYIRMGSSGNELNLRILKKNEREKEKESSSKKNFHLSIDKVKNKEKEKEKSNELLLKDKKLMLVDNEISNEEFINDTEENISRSPSKYNSIKTHSKFLSPSKFNLADQVVVGKSVFNYDNIKAGSTANRDNVDKD